MILVESDVTLYTTTIGGKDALDKYYRVIKAQIDTIKAQVLYCNHDNAYAKKKGYADEKLKTLKGEDTAFK